MKVKMQKGLLFIYYTIKLKKTSINILYFILLFFTIGLSKEENLEETSKIILKIKGKGDQFILSNAPGCNYTDEIPDIIYVNIFIIKLLKKINVKYEY